MGLTVVPSVITTANSYDLTTLLAVLGDLNLNDADAATKLYLRRLIAQCSASIAQDCNRVFASETVEDSIYAEPGRRNPGSSVLQLSRWPVSSVTTVTENGTALTGADYKLDGPAGQLLRLNTSSPAALARWCAFPVVVRYVAGYATIPADLEDAAIRLVKARWLARERDPFLKSENVPGVLEQTYWITADKAGNFTPDIEDILDNYRMPVVV